MSVETSQPADALAGLAGVHDLRIEDGKTEFSVDGDRVDDVMSTLAPLGVQALVAHPPTLEQLLMRHYGDELAETAGQGASQ